MRNCSLLIMTLLFALAVGNTNAQNAAQHPLTSRDGEFLVQGFEDGMAGWTYQNEAGSYGIINGTFAHSGSYSFRMKSADLYLGYLISPELPDSENGVDVEFYYALKTSNSTEFKVGYSMSTNDPNDFIWGDVVYLDVVSNSPSEWQHYVQSFPANVKYVAVAKSTIGGFLYVDDFAFTYADCAMPSVPVATATSNSISLSWSGSSSSYSLRYAPYYEEDFVVDLGDWTPSFGSQSWAWNSHIEYSHYAAGSAMSDVTVSHHNNYLVSSAMPSGSRVTFYYKGIVIPGSEGGFFKEFSNRDDSDMCFKVMVSTAENPTVNDFTQYGEVITASSEFWKRFTVDLSGYTGICHVAICHVYTAKEGKSGGTPEPTQYKLAIDDITIYYPWEQIENLQATTYTIENTDAETYYAIQLKGDCDQWTDALTVLTPPATMPDTYEFISAGYWSDAQNWKNWLMPPVGADVTIKAAARIPANYVAEVGNITLTSSGSLTILDGGQLKHNNSGVKATMEKYIMGYTGENDHYVLIAFPTDNNINMQYNYLNNFVYSDFDDVPYDLYEFNQDEELQWINYDQPDPEPIPGELPPPPYHPFNIIRNAKGYLYARESSATLRFTTNGDYVYISNGLKPSNNDITVNLAYSAGKEFAGWNLLGNPFACNAYLTGNRPFFRLVETEDGSTIQLASEANGGNVIAPMEGIFVKATSTSQHATFTATEPQNNGDGLMDFTLRKSNTRSAVSIDRSRIVFGEGDNITHLDLMADPNRLYFPIDDKAMAVVYAQPVGELPLNFEAASEGSFVLGFECRAENLVYCHLIDNLTGADVDLLHQNEYTFETHQTDYASRFRIVFATGSSVDGEGFGFINSMGNLCIFGIEGTATLQVMDITGRILSSETFSGSYEKSLNVTPGVYLLRLVNGNDVKVQKIVVR